MAHFEKLSFLAEVTFNHMNDIRNDYKLVFKITHHSAFSYLNVTIPLLYLLPTPDQEDQKIFHEVPITVFRRHHCKSQSPSVKKKEGSCGPCKKFRCEICDHIVDTDSFK